MADNWREDLGEVLPRNQRQAGQTPGGSQAGGGPSPSDMAAADGSSGAGGYRRAQNQQLNPGQQDSAEEIANDQAEHQDRGQGVAAAEGDRD